MALGRRYPSRSLRSRSPRSRYTLGLLLLTAVTLLAVDLPATRPLRPVRNVVGTILSPVRWLGDTIFGPVGNAWHGTFDYDDVKRERDELSAQLDEAKSAGAEVERLEAENAELRRLLQITPEGVTTKTGEVISGPISNFDPTIQIDLGSDDGVKQGMAVITGLSEGTEGGLLGRVTLVQGSRSTVSLVTSSSFQVGAIVGGNQAVLVGRGPGRPLVVEGLPLETEVKKGDWVTTSRMDDSQFPKNLKIGQVTAVRTSTSGLSKTVDVDPMADLSGVLVKVVMKDPPR